MNQKLCAWIKFIWENAAEAIFTCSQNTDGGGDQSLYNDSRLNGLDGTHTHTHTVGDSA